MAVCPTRPKPVPQPPKRVGRRSPKDIYENEPTGIDDVSSESDLDSEKRLDSERGSVRPKKNTNYFRERYFFEIEK